MAEEGRQFPSTGKIPARKFQPPAEGIKNQFANDGSFLEMFKKQMEKKEQTNKAISPEVSAEDGANSDPKKSATKTPLLSTTSNDKITISSDDLSQNTRTTLINTDALTTGLFPLVGKRRSDSRRTLKTGIVKKLRINSSDTADSAPTNASTKYTEEVKRYKATMCVEDEKSRPLVKNYLVITESNRVENKDYQCQGAVPVRGKKKCAGGGPFLPPPLPSLVIFR